MTNNNKEILFKGTFEVYKKKNYLPKKNKYRILIQSKYISKFCINNCYSKKNKILKFIQKKLFTLRIKFKEVVLRKIFI